MADVLIAPAQTADELSLGAEESPPFFTPSPCAAGARSRANSKRDGYEPYGARIRASGGRGMGQQIWLADQNARSCRVICCADGAVTHLINQIQHGAASSSTLSSKSVAFA